MRITGVFSLRLILLSGILFRLAALVWYLSTHGWKGETWEHEVIANSLLAGEGLAFPFHGSVYLSGFPPIFPMVCAALHWLGGPGFTLFYCFHLSCAGGIIFLTYQLARRLFGDEAAGYAGWLAALEPGLIIYQSYKVDVVTLSTLFGLLALWGFLRVIRTQQLRYTTATGMAVGLGMLVRPDVVAFMGAPILWAIRERLKFPASRKLFIIIAAATLALSPWVIRNYAIHGRFIPTMSFSGQILWIGNNPNSTATLWTQEGKPQYSAAPEEFKRRIEGAGELANLDLFRSTAISYIVAHPSQFIRRCLNRLFYFWWFSPSYAKSPQYVWAPSILALGYKIVYLLVLILALVGTVFAAKESMMEVALLWSPPVALDLIHCFHYVEGRHRLLILPLILILSGRGIAGLRTRWWPGA